MMNIKDALICGYYDEDVEKNYIVEVDVNKLKKWFEQEELDLLDFETNMTKRLIVYDILKENFTKDLTEYENFTIKFY